MKRSTMKKKILFAAFSVAAVAFCAAGSANVTAFAENDFTMTMATGASVRLVSSTDEARNGIRFSMSLPQAQYEEAEGYYDVQYGIVIAPRYYVDLKEFSEANLFGENAVYTWAGKSFGSKTGAATILHATPAYSEDSTNETAVLYAAVIDMLDENRITEYVGRGYVAYKVNESDEYTFVLADYVEGEVDNHSRSMTYVAQRAIAAGKDIDGVLYNSYVADYEATAVNYTVNYYRTDESYTYVQHGAAVEVESTINATVDSVAAPNGLGDEYILDETISSSGGLVYANGRTEFNAYYYKPMLIDKKTTDTLDYAAKLDGEATSYTLVKNTATGDVAVATLDGTALNVDDYADGVYTITAVDSTAINYKMVIDLYNSDDGMVYNVLTENVTQYAKGLHYNNKNGEDYLLSDAVYSDGALSVTVQKNNWDNNRATVLIAPMHSKAYYAYFKAQGDYKGIKVIVTADANANFTEGAGTDNGTWTSKNTAITMSYSLDDILANYDELCDLTLADSKNTLAKFFSCFWIKDGAQIKITALNAVSTITAITDTTAHLVDVKDLTSYDLTTAMSEENKAEVQGWSGLNVTWKLTPNCSGATATSFASTEITVAELPKLCTYTVTAEYKNTVVYTGTYDFYNSAEGMVYNVIDEDFAKYVIIAGCTNGEVYNGLDMTVQEGKATAAYTALNSNSWLGIKIRPLHTKAYYELWTESGASVQFSLTQTIGTDVGVFGGAAAWHGKNTAKVVAFTAAQIVENYDTFADDAEIKSLWNGTDAFNTWAMVFFKHYGNSGSFTIDGLTTVIE